MKLLLGLTSLVLPFSAPVTAAAVQSVGNVAGAGSARPATPQLRPDRQNAIARVGRFYVGGQTIAATYPNAGNDTPVTGATMVVQQSLVLHVVPDRITEPYPVVMIPGLGLSSYLYMATPDGREGWATLFARAGFEVYVFEDPLTSPSGGFDVNLFNAARRGDASAADQPELTIWTNEEIWSRWGFGSDFEVPYPDTRFPVASIDQFYAAIPQRHSYPANSGQFGSTFKAAVLVELLEDIGPSILMLHSAAGQTGLKAARTRPDLVPAFVLLEPAGIPDASDFPTFAGKSMLGIYGDYIAERGQSGRLTACLAAADLFTQNGGVGEVIQMVEDQGVFGNTHIMMQDNNSHDIAGLVQAWLELHIQ